MNILETVVADRIFLFYLCVTIGLTWKLAHDKLHVALCSVRSKNYKLGSLNYVSYTFLSNT